jgi:hypothetical protein
MPDARSSRSRIIGALIVFAPVLVPAAFVLALLVAFLVLMVVSAFEQGFVEGCSALAALIGIPSLELLWLSKAMQVLGGGRAAARPLLDKTAHRYASGDFVHRDWEAERRDGRVGA